MSTFTKSQIEDLLTNVLDTPKMTGWKGSKIQFCCTIHGESHPSCGIDIDYCPPDEPEFHGAAFNCFACGQHGSIEWLVYKSLPDRFHSASQAEKFLRKRYGITTRYFEKDSGGVLLHRYNDKFIDLDDAPENKRVVKPMSTLAPLKSGKQTYQYFFNRGFDKSDMKKYMIGRNLTDETVTIPVVREDSTLAGVIGRYIDPNRPKNSRYRIYDFRRGALIYPLDKVEPVEDTLILMESQFDVIMMNKWGFPNAVCTMTNKVSREQAQQIADRCSKLIVLCDLDDRGQVLLDTAKHHLQKSGVHILLPTYKPKSGKDPSEWGEKETLKVLNSVKYMGLKKIHRL